MRIVTCGPKQTEIKNKERGSDGHDKTQNTKWQDLLDRGKIVLCIIRNVSKDKEDCEQ